MITELRRIKSSLKDRRTEAARMANRLHAAVNWVALARSTDSPRAILMGLHVEEKRIVATDGRRLHVAEFPDSITAFAPGHYRVLKVGAVI